MSSLNVIKRLSLSKRGQIVAIVAISLIVYGILNNQWLIAQLRYATLQPAPPVSAEILAPHSPDPLSPASITIPAINVQAPVITNETSTEDPKVQLSLQKGVLLYGNSAKPNESGNTVIVGHSSGRIWKPGDYKWVFTLLDKLKPGDEIVVSYQGIPYVYRVTGSMVVSPQNQEILRPTTKPTLTLITCTPVGTDKNRLAVTAELDTSPR